MFPSQQLASQPASSRTPMFGQPHASVVEDDGGDCDGGGEEDNDGHNNIFALGLRVCFDYPSFASCGISPSVHLAWLKPEV